MALALEMAMAGIEIMTDRITELAKQCGFHGAGILHIYGGNVDALCDSEIRELEAIKRFAELVRAEALEYAACVLEGSPVTINNIQHRGTPHAGSWQVDSVVGRFVSTNAAKIRSLK